MELASVERLELASSGMSERWPETDLFKRSSSRHVTPFKKKRDIRIQEECQKYVLLGSPCQMNSARNHDSDLSCTDQQEEFWKTLSSPKDFI